MPSSALLAGRQGASVRSGAHLFALHGLTAFLAAGLLFLIEPMATKALLPVLGGSAGVWSAALVFYQTLLLLGYAYSHLVTRLLPLRAGAAVHVVVVVIAALRLPFGGLAAPQAAPASLPPALWLIGALAASVGAPFFALAATGPLVQRWFASATGREPHPLYSIGNASSLLALLAYPLLVERYLPLSAHAGAESLRSLTQSGLWC